MKCGSAPFFETSPILFDISQLENWKKVASGLLKMYEGEVMAKFPIVQHLRFGQLFEKNFKSDGLSSNNHHPQSQTTTTTNQLESNNDNNEIVSTTQDIHPNITHPPTSTQSTQSTTFDPMRAFMTKAPWAK